MFELDFKLPLFVLDAMYRIIVFFYVGKNARDVKWSMLKNVQSLEDCCAGMDHDRNILKAYLSLLGLCKTDNIEKGIVKLFACGKCLK